MTSEMSRSTAGLGQLYESVLDTIGNTPSIRINNLAPPHVRVYVKAEFFNPIGSVKDRLAVSIIEEAERSGALKPGQTVVEATSGNTGIGLAMVCAAKGYPLVVTMAESFSIERRKLMRFLGAKVVLTPRAEKGFGMYRKAVELAETNGWFLAHQFETDANALIHENTTAREILADFDGARLDYYVTGYGTGGTLAGVGRVLRPSLWSCRKRSTGAISTSSSQWRGRSASNGRASWRSGKAFSQVYPVARRSPSRCKSPSGPAQGRPSCACCPIPANAICPPRSSTVSWKR
ncbi:MAG: PLP-dependent cysteine synthase family protein [Chromatiaceae bacterium]